MRKLLMSLMLLLAAFSLQGCGYNTLQSTDEQIKAVAAYVASPEFLQPH